MEFSQKVIDNLLGLFDIMEKSPPTESIFNVLRRKIRSRVIRSFTQNIAQLLGSSCRCHNSGMISYILSRSFHGLCRTLRMLISRTSFIFSSMSTRQGTLCSSWNLRFRHRILRDSFLFSVQIVSYSDSDWAGYHRSRRSMSGSLLTLFGGNVSSTSRTRQASHIHHKRAELHAVTQASVESLALKHFTQVFDSMLFLEMSRLLSRPIVEQARQWPHIWASQESQSTLKSGIMDSRCRQ